MIIPPRQFNLLIEKNFSKRYSFDYLYVPYSKQQILSWWKNRKNNEKRGSSSKRMLKLRAVINAFACNAAWSTERIGAALITSTRKLTHLTVINSHSVISRNSKKKKKKKLS